MGTDGGRLLSIEGSIAGLSYALLRDLWREITLFEPSAIALAALADDVPSRT